MTSKQDLLQHLADDWGYEDVMEMLEWCITDSVAPGICTDEECSYSTEVEPDCTDGYCEECGKNTVCSCMILAGVI